MPRNYRPSLDIASHACSSSVKQRCPHPYSWVSSAAVTSGIVKVFPGMSHQQTLRFIVFTVIPAPEIINGSFLLFWFLFWFQISTPWNTYFPASETICRSQVNSKNIPAQNLSQVKRYWIRKPWKVPKYGDIATKLRWVAGEIVTFFLLSFAFDDYANQELPNMMYRNPLQGSVTLHVPVKYTRASFRLRTAFSEWICQIMLKILPHTEMSWLFDITDVFDKSCK